MTQPIEVLVRDRSSGRIHRRYRQEGSTELLSYEADNADTAGDFDLISEEELAATPAHLICKRCFAEDERYRDAPSAKPTTDELVAMSDDEFAGFIRDSGIRTASDDDGSTHNETVP